MNKLVVVAPLEIARRFAAIVAPNFILAENLRERNRILRETRDLLLPKLISGEIDVEAVDRETVEAVA